MKNAGLREPGKMHYRTIFPSHVHLGTKGCQADLLLGRCRAHALTQGW